MPLPFGGPGVTPNLGNLVTNIVALQAGEVWTVPSGRFAIQRGKYTAFQEYDPIAQFWRPSGAGETAAGIATVFSDGNNYRLANQTGCAIGALITNAGTLYTSPPVVTESAGASTWRAIVGGAVSTAVTVSNGGLNYTYPPTVLISPPPPGGIQATAYCTLSGGAVSTVTIVDQGAGYTIPPPITFVNDPRETNPPPGSTATLGYNAAAVTVLTGAGTITGLICTDHGTVVTTLPTLTFTGGGGSGAAATVIMCWTITAYTVSTTTTGSGLVAPILLSAYGGFPATAPAYTNPTTQSTLIHGRAASILASVIQTPGSLTATGQTVYDGGIYAGVPTLYVSGAGPYGAGPVSPVLTASMGGNSGGDVSYIFPT